MSTEAPRAAEEAPGSNPPTGVAAFDFDGTLTREDTMMPFLPRARSWPRVVGATLLSTPRACLHSAYPRPPSRAVLLKAPSPDGEPPGARLHRARARTNQLFQTRRDGFRDGLKVATVGRLFRRMTLAEVEELGRDYAQAIRELLRPEMLERVRWHQEQGHATVIVSASLAVYLRPVAEELGIDGVLGVELTADDQGILTGRVDGDINTRGPHKVARLLDWLDARFGPGAEVELWAYGDSPGDNELLALADHPTWIR